MTVGSRRTGRAYALQLLYARDGDPATDVTGAAVSWADAFDLEVEEGAQLFARDLVSAATEKSDRRHSRRAASAFVRSSARSRSTLGGSCEHDVHAARRPPRRVLGLGLGIGAASVTGVGNRQRVVARHAVKS